MNSRNALNSLFFCSICFYPHKGKKNTGATLLMGHCLHIICDKCLKKTDYCLICDEKTSMTPVSSSISKRLSLNPSELFLKPIDITMFQINNSINLIYHLKDDLMMHKKLLNLARNEIEKLKRKIQNNCRCSPFSIRNKKPSINKYQSDLSNKRTDQIPVVYYENRNGVKANIKKVYDKMCNRKNIKTIPDEDNTIIEPLLNFSNITNTSDSSRNTKRISIPKDFNPYRKFYKK